MKPSELLRNYFEKILLIQLSAKPINNSWAENLHLILDRYVFTNPFLVDEETDKMQVQLFNKLMGTNDTSMKWRVPMNSGCKLFINKKNKHEFAENAVSQLYLQLSILVFENLIVFLNSLLKKSKKNGTSEEVINNFYEEFEEQIKELDTKNLSFKHPTITLLHNLRIFRNCVTHADSSVEYIENKIQDFNLGKRNFPVRKKILNEIGCLPKIMFSTKFTTDYKLFLDKKSFQDLCDLYSQIAYVSYMCYCEKHNYEIEF